MTITKKEFKENIKVEIRDYRTEREKNEEMEHRLLLSANWYRKTYFVGEATMKEFFWVFHERTEEFPKISILNGENGYNRMGSLYIHKGKYKSSYFISIYSDGSIHCIGDERTKFFKAKNSKDVLRLGRMVRDMLE